MIKVVSKNPLVQKIVDGAVKADLMDMLIRKELPLTEEEYLECLVYALRNDSYKVNALQKLRDIPDSVKISYVEKSDANQRVSYFIVVEALERHNNAIIARVVRNQAMPVEFLQKIAEKGSADDLEILIDNQIKLIAYPDLLNIIEKNPVASNFIKGKIQEIREFYLSAQMDDIKAEDVMDDVKELLSQSSQINEDNDADSITPEDGDDDISKIIEIKTLSALQEINMLNISERIKLALVGSKTQRMILIKDTNKLVALAVLSSPKIGIDEIAQLVNNKSISAELIARISKNRDWTKNYNIIMELVHNPKTPLQEAMGFVKQLFFRDLELVARSKNVNPVIRTVAMNYLRQKSGVKKKE